MYLLGLAGICVCKPGRTVGSLGGVSPAHAEKQGEMVSKKLISLSSSEPSPDHKRQKKVPDYDSSDPDQTTNLYRTNNESRPRGSPEGRNADGHLGH